MPWSATSAMDRMSQETVACQRMSTEIDWLSHQPRWRLFLVFPPTTTATRCAIYVRSLEMIYLLLYRILIQTSSIVPVNGKTVTGRGCGNDTFCDKRGGDGGSSRQRQRGVEFTDDINGCDLCSRNLCNGSVRMGWSQSGVVIGVLSVIMVGIWRWKDCRIW